MALGMLDTTPEAEAVYVRLIRAMSPEQKLRRISDLTCTVRALALSGLRHDFPDASEADLHRRLAARVLGPEIARRAYNWDVLKEGP